MEKFINKMYGCVGMAVMTQIFQQGMKIGSCMSWLVIRVLNSLALD